MKVLIISSMFSIGYLYGSIPFALVIGKIFYKTDVRKFGSGNLGGTNTGRVLGKQAGVACIVLDASKALLITLISSTVFKATHIDPTIGYLCGVACVVGHCYPIFANFKGGKAVSTGIGYFLVVSPLGGILALCVFFIILKVSKYVSLSSMLASFSVLVVTPWLNIPFYAKIANALIISLMVYRHKENIKRIINKTESKINWM